MIFEQIRYFIDPGDREAVLAVRREMRRVRQELNLPPGQILLADEEDGDGPLLVWQCVYRDESDMGQCEAAMISHREHAELQSRLGALKARIELEVFVSDEEPD